MPELKGSTFISKYLLFSHEKKKKYFVHGIFFITIKRDCYNWFGFRHIEPFWIDPLPPVMVIFAPLIWLGCHFGTASLIHRSDRNSIHENGNNFGALLSFQTIFPSFSSFSQRKILFEVYSLKMRILLLHNLPFSILLILVVLCSLFSNRF